MGQRIAINREGVFKLDNRAYRIPWTFSRRPVQSYRVLTEPLQASLGLKQLTASNGSKPVSTSCGGPPPA